LLVAPHLSLPSLNNVNVMIMALQTDQRPTVEMALVLLNPVALRKLIRTIRPSKKPKQPS
jgi:hypothetical protein